MEVLKVKRRIKYKGEYLTDPNENLPMDKVLDFYSDDYPEFTNATLKAPTETTENGTHYLDYEVKEVIGNKG